MHGSSVSCGFRVAALMARSARLASASSVGERRGARLQRRQPLDQLVEEHFVQGPLAGKRAVACAEHAVLEALELGRDVALGVLDGLAARLVRRHPVGLVAVHLDVVTLDAVVAEA